MQPKFRMSLFLATLLPGLFLALLGSLLLPNLSLVTATLKGLPRSPVASFVLFGGGVVWFLVLVANMAEADRIFGSSTVPWVIGFAVLGVLALKYVPDFLAVRGLSILVLLAAWPLLHAAFMEYEVPQRLFMVTIVFVAIAAAWLAQTKHVHISGTQFMPEELWLVLASILIGLVAAILPAIRVYRIDIFKTLVRK